MRLPVILLTGEAGSGKDTIASCIAKHYPATVIAQADPMKRFAKRVFGYSEEQLWGPSAMRNTEVDLPRSAELLTRFCTHSTGWLREVLPGIPDIALESAQQRLMNWLSAFDQGTIKRTSPRHVLQTLGTEWGRSFSRNMWVDLALDSARDLLGGGLAYDRTDGLRRSSLPAPEWVVITDGRFRNEVLAVSEAGGVVVRVESPGSGLRGVTALHASETEQKGIPEHLIDAVIVNNKVHGFSGCKFAVDALMTDLIRRPARYHTWGPRESAQ